MFKSLFKKKSGLKKNEKQRQQNCDSKVDQDVLKEDLVLDEKKLETENDKDKQIHLLNKIGDANFRLNQVNEAIESWNKSASLMDKPGYAHTKLMQGYNFLQTEAWKAGDTGAGEHYAEMIDKLMKHNKDSIRYGKQ